MTKVQVLGANNAQLFFENLIDKKCLAEKLEVSESYINKLMKAEGLPYFKIGRTVRFNGSEVLAWLSQRRMP